ncbi:MAG: hypothetical protein KDD62_03720, partial [Bdellovibrionales bacterium]|nr:hypothetical protein [Bdellovibrionales bacterium]
TMFPLCYVGMNADKWREFLGLSIGNPVPYLLRDLHEMETQAQSVEFCEYWYADQRFLTKKVFEFGFEHFDSIERGKDSSGLPLKRVDRSNWQWDRERSYVDCHMLKKSCTDESFKKTYDLVTHVLSGNQSWMLEYQRKFKALLAGQSLE